MNTGCLHADFAGGTTAGMCPRLERVFSPSGERVADDAWCRVRRVDDGERRYSLKRDVGSDKARSLRRFGLRPWLGVPRLRSAWWNPLAFQSWRIPTTALVAYGLQRRVGAFAGGAVLGYRIVKDLACLGKGVKAHCGSRRQCLRFLHDAVPHQRPCEAERQRIGKIVGFFDGRK